MKGTGSPTFCRKAAKDFRDSSCSCTFSAFISSYTALTEATSSSNSEEKTKTPPHLQSLSVLLFTCFHYSMHSYYLSKHILPILIYNIPNILDILRNLLAIPITDQSTQPFQPSFLLRLGGQLQVCAGATKEQKPDSENTLLQDVRCRAISFFLKQMIKSQKSSKFST